MDATSLLVGLALGVLLGALAAALVFRVLVSARSATDRRAQADALLQPVSDALGRVDRKIEEIERDRREAYGGLSRHLESLAQAQAELGTQTAGLVRALRAPEVRGRWGEIQLRRVVELAGMLEHCDFEEQPVLQDDDSRARPDLLVHLPGGRTVVVDAKAPLHHMLEAYEAEDPESRASLMKQHAQTLRRHVQELGSRAYWDRLEGSPELVVLFLPGDGFLSTAMEQDAGLFDFAASSHVILATPTTLIALLKAIAYGWRQERAAENAREITALGRELFDRLRAFADHLRDVRKALDRAVLAYNRAVGSLESRLLVTARRFRELGASTGDDIEQARGVQRTTRRIADPELAEGGEEDSGGT